jgi:hypothetical protein
MWERLSSSRQWLYGKASSEVACGCANRWHHSLLQLSLQAVVNKNFSFLERPGQTESHHFMIWAACTQILMMIKPTPNLICMLSPAIVQFIPIIPILEALEDDIKTIASWCTSIIMLLCSSILHVCSYLSYTFVILFHIKHCKQIYCCTFNTCWLLYVSIGKGPSYNQSSEYLWC